MLIGSLHVNVYDTMSAVDIHRLTRRITETMLERHGIVLTVSIYAIATGDSKQARIQRTVTQALKAHQEIQQVHGFCYFEDERRISVDVVPDISVKDEARLAQELTKEIQTLLPDERITIIVDHNYSS